MAIACLSVLSPQPRAAAHNFYFCRITARLENQRPRFWTGLMSVAGLADYFHLTGLFRLCS
jgi:hypothetical protein